MRQQDQAIQTDGRRQSRQCFGLTLRDVLTMGSALILPLVLGVFTIITTNNQQKEAIRQSEKDAELRRQEWQIENNQSERQWAIAEQQNNFQRQLALEKYQEEILMVYIKETGDLLEKSNGSLASNPIITTIARAKTLNTIRQLDARRSSDVIRFLYEAGQLTDTNQTRALNVSTVELCNINKNIFEIPTKVAKLSLMGIYLRNCMFNNTLLHDIDFSSAQIDHMNFSAADVHDVAISSAKLQEVEFTSAILKDVEFTSATLKDVEFTSAILKDVDFCNIERC